MTDHHDSLAGGSSTGRDVFDRLDLVTLIAESTYRDSGRIGGADTLRIDVDAAELAGRGELLDAMSEALDLPLDASISTWSGLEGRLHEWIAVSDATRSVVVLRNADRLTDTGLGTLLTFVSVVRDVARHHANEPTRADDRAHEMVLVLTGSTPSFPTDW